MRAVYKYELEITDEQELLMLRGAQPRLVGMQGGKLCLWASVDPLLNPDDTEMRRFRVAGTGYVLPDGLAYIGTVLDDTREAWDGPRLLVWHVFEDFGEEA